ncbi:MAG: hypothetical protein RL318_105 [Fibrobacterota bacterium]|jgi:PAS domain S-box-containing protein
MGTRKVRMRHWLMLRMGFIAVGLVSMMSFLNYQFLAKPASTALQVSEFDAASHLAKLRSEAIVQSVERKLELLERQMGANSSPLSDATWFRRAAGALMAESQELDGVVMADSSGQSRSLLRKDGRWIERWVGHRDAGTRLCEMDSLLLKAGACRDSTDERFDASSREWFRLAQGAGGRLAWSDPYKFAYNGKYGITLARSFRDAAGRVRVVGLHLLLERQMQVTRTVSLGKRGFVFLASGSGKLLTLPRGRGDSSWILKPLQEIDDPILPVAYATAVAGRSREPQRYFRIAGEDWIVKASPIQSSGRGSMILAVAPQGEYDGNLRRSVLLLLGGCAVLLFLAAWFAHRLTSVLTRQLDALGQQVEQIGNLDFSTSISIDTPWLELERLAVAHDAMRTILDQTTANMEEEIQQKTAQLRKFYLTIEQSPFAVLITDRAGIIEYANPFAQRTSGYSQEELIGKNPRILRSPEADPMALVDLWDTIQTGDVWKGDFLNRSKYGRDYLESAIVAPIHDGELITHFVAIKEDVTQIKAAQKQLSDQLALLEQVLDAIPNPIFLKDSRERYLLCNRAYEEAFGTIREFVQGKTVMDFAYLTMEQRLSRVRDDKRVLEDGVEINELVQARLADGREHDLIGWLKRFQLADGTVGGIFGMMMDVSEMKAKERELEAAREVAEEATRTKSSFLASMSHEIRTPMNAVIGMAHLALRTKLDSQQRDYVQKIHRAATALLEILNDILDFSKIEAGKFLLEAQEFSLSDLLASVADLHRHKAREKGIEYLHRVSQRLPEHFVGDSLRLGQILTNLLGNAFKFTDKGDVILSVEMLEDRGDALLLKFSIRDTGIGLTQEQQGRLFQAFSQADDSNSRKYGGTGLGLAISKRLAELMGGSIGVESETGKGSCFWFTVQLGTSQASESAMPFDSLGRRTLVVDDNPVVSEILAAYLVSMGMAADQASSGRDAMEMLVREDAAGKPYEILFLDRKMPGEDGILVARQVKQSALRKMPAVVMVTSVDEELQALCRSIPLDGVLDKPVSPHALRRTLDDILGYESAPGDSSVAAEEFGLGGFKILVVENEPVNQQIAKELLESQGVDVSIADDGQMALTMLESQGYDIVLMDLQMPGMDGYEATRALRSRGVEIPILAMTASVMQDEREACLEAGMNDHIAKPIEPRKLFATLARWGAQGGGVPVRPVREAKVLFPLIRGIETEDGLERCGGNAEMYAQFLTEFADRRLDMQPVRELLEKRQVSEAKVWLHSFKGIAGNLGAMPLFAAVVALERCLREDSLETAISHLPRIEEMTEELRTEIQANLRPDPLDSHDLELQELPGEIAKVARLLREADADAVEAFERIRKIFGKVHGQNWTTRLSRKIRDYAFDEALELLQELPRHAIGAHGDVEEDA